MAETSGSRLVTLSLVRGDHQLGFGASHIHNCQNFIALYLQDTWKATTRLTVNAGQRFFEPFFAPCDSGGKGAFYSKERFDKGLKSEIFPNAPAGIYFQGEAEFPTRWP
jgi:hypothetical protein